MLRKVIKIDENGNEVKDEQGNFVFEEIEVLSDAETSANTELIEEAAEEVVQDAVSDGETDAESGGIDPKDEEIERLKAQVEELKKQLNIEEPLKQIEILEAESSAILNSLGFDTKTQKIR